MHLRAATWNIHGCIGTDGIYAPQRVAEVISGLTPDVIALQEVDDRLPRQYDHPQFRYLLQATGLHGVAGPTLRDHDGHYGNAVLSRFPLEAVHRIDLSVPPHEPRGALRVLVRHSEGAVWVIATHLGLNLRERREQIRRLLREVAGIQRGTPMLLLGDFNEWLPIEGPRLRRLTAGLPLCITGRTFPSKFPLLPLDRIYAGPQPTRAEGRTCRDMAARLASDHLPVVASISWA